MAKLHEVLAVESGLQSAAKKTNDDTITTFGKRDENFISIVRQMTYFNDEETRLNTIETKEMPTTVPDRLNALVAPNARALDAYLQKEATNQKATADIVIGDAILAADVPGTVLLGLETKLAELRKVYEAIPTLAPGPVWVLDADTRKGVYKAQTVATTFSTRKTMRVITMAAATEHHPAQVATVPEDVAVAKIEVQAWSGMMTVAHKTDLLERLDQLLRAVKRARQRANATEVVVRDIGRTLFDFVHEGIVA